MTGAERVEITDVTLRDGLQDLPAALPIDAKISLYERIVAAGVASLEIGSFVHPGRVPQMADTDRLYERLERTAAVRRFALIPNLRGAQRAISAGVSDARIVLSCSEGHSVANTRRSVADGIADAVECIGLLREHGIAVETMLATAFHCPFDGPTSEERVGEVIAALSSDGLDTGRIILCDTLGKADPAGLTTTVAYVQSRHPDAEFGLHLHNTYGMALANVHAALALGIRQFDAAMGGIGGCPFAPGAAGNLALEDVVFMLHALGYRTGIDLERLSLGVAELDARIPVPLESSLPRALGWTRRTDPAPTASPTP